MSRDFPPPKFPQAVRVRLGPDRFAPVAWEWNGHWYVTQAVLSHHKEAWVDWTVPELCEVSVFRLLATDQSIAELAWAHRERCWGIRRIID